MDLPNGNSLIQETFLRSALINGVNEILTVTNKNLLKKTKDAYSNVNIQGMKTSFILEPEGRNTAAAIAIAALYLSRTHSTETIMIILPADHVIDDHSKFVQVVERAISMTQESKLVTFGVKPDRPDTGYGYIQHHETDVKRFVEKPDLNRAGEYISEGNFLWNSGIFCFSVNAVLSEMEIHCPTILRAAHQCIDETDFSNKNGEFLLDSDKFKEVPADSFDYAVMEKSTKVSVVSGLSGWNDVGNWATYGTLFHKDTNNNNLKGNIVPIETSDSVILGDKRTIGTVGIDNMIIVDTPDALLVGTKNHSHRIGEIFKTLELSQHKSTIDSITEKSTSGEITVLDDSPELTIKKLLVSPNQSINVETIIDCQNTWLVIFGKALFVTKDKSHVASNNQSFYTTEQNLVTITNMKSELLLILEITTAI